MVIAWELPGRDHQATEGRTGVSQWGQCKSWLTWLQLCIHPALEDRRRGGSKSRDVREGSPGVGEGGDAEASLQN